MRNWDQITIGGQTIDQKYGVTRDTAARYKVGFARAEVHLFDLLSQKFSLAGTDFIAASGFGLVSIPPSNPFRAFNFFNGRIVFPYPAKNAEMGTTNTIYFSGRTTDLTPDDDFFRDRKIIHQKTEAAGLKEMPLYLDPVPGSPAILVEGSMHALRLRQEGFAACAMGGAKPNEGQIEQLKREHEIFWIPDVDILAPTESRVEETSQGKRFIPGKTREQKLEHLLPVMQKLPQCRIVRYDSTDKGTAFAKAHDHGDMNDWWIENPDPAEFLKLLDAAVDAETAEILSIPPTLSATERTARINKWLPRIAGKSPLEYADSLEQLKRHLHIPNDQITYLKRQVKKLREDGLEKSGTTEDFALTANFSKIYPGQDFVNGRLYYTVSVKKLITKYKNNQPIEIVDEKPYMISSDGEFFPANETELTRRRLYFPKGCVPDNVQQFWSDSPDVLYSIPNWLEARGKNTPDTAELYQEIRQYFKDHTYLEDESYYDFLSLFTMVTFAIQIFDSFGYLALNGTRGTGKSRVMELIEGICFDPVKGSSQSDSFIFRTVDTRSPCMFLDEAESLSSLQKTKDQVNEKSLILNDGYRKGGGVGRCIGQDNTPYTFRTYTVYVIANTRGLYATLQSRTFFFPMIRRPRDVKLKSWNRSRLAKRTAAIRNKLYCWTLSNAENIAGKYAQLDDGKLSPMLDYVGLNDREREIWIPIYTMALTIDDLCGKPFTYDRNAEAYHPDLQSTICGHIIEAEHNLSVAKNDIMLSEDQFPQFLGALRVMLKDNLVQSCSIPTQPPERRDDWYKMADITKWLRSIQGFQFYPTERGQNTIRHLLTKKCKVCKESDLIRYQPPGSRSKPTYLRLDPKRLERTCNDYNVPDEVDLEPVEVPVGKSTPAEDSASPANQQEAGF